VPFPVEKLIFEEVSHLQSMLQVATEAVFGVCFQIAVPVEKVVEKVVHKEVCPPHAASS
jgi:hypothetical protein